ncbi:MAG: Fic family protein, partial [Rikenellaceae bacterium]
KNFDYRNLVQDDVVRHIAKFTSDLWQIHPFEEGNTRTTALFVIKYLRTLGFDVTNDAFAAHSWYFRNALVRANYKNIPQGIFATTLYIELFFRNLLLSEQNELKNRELHITAQNESR